MLVFSAGIKKPLILDEEKHRGLKLKLPSDLSHTKNLVTVPLTYSEIVAATMYYPVLFSVNEGLIYPFAVLGVNDRNLFLNDEGQFIVDVVPRLVWLYPFGIANRDDEYFIVFDGAMRSEDGEYVIYAEGNFSPLFHQKKEELTEIASDLKDALEFSQSALENGLLKHLGSLRIDSKHGSLLMNNVFIANAVEAIPKLSPEKLYHFNVLGYIPVLYATYFSVRNFKLFDLIT